MERDHQKPLTVPEALKKVAEQVRELSGYPSNTTSDPTMALAYGYTIGLILKAAQEWEGESGRK